MGYTRSTRYLRNRRVSRVKSLLMATDELDQERADRLRELIESGGWEVADLARAVGADPSQIYRWQKGERVSSRKLGQLAETLGTTRNYIASGEGRRSTHDQEVLDRLDQLEAKVIEELRRLERDLGPHVGVSAQVAEAAAKAVERSDRADRGEHPEGEEEQAETA